MTAIAKLGNTHPAAKKFCGWEEPAMCVQYAYNRFTIYVQKVYTMCKMCA